MDDFKPVDDTRVVADSQPVARKEGLLAGRISWGADAFAPMTEEQVAEFDGDPANHVERPNPI
jgi:hypothetical protein